VIRAWFWLAAESDDVEEERRCVEALPELDPEHQATQAGLVLLHHRQVRELHTTSIGNIG